MEYENAAVFNICSITSEGLKSYRVFNRRYRNTRIGEFLKELHLTEGRNTDCKKILNSLERNGSPKPIFETDADRLSFAATILIHPYFNHHDDGVNDGVNDVVTYSLNENETKVYAEIKKDGSLTAAKMAELLCISKPTVERAISSLKQKGYIIRQGAPKKGKWIAQK